MVFCPRSGILAWYIIPYHLPAVTWRQRNLSRAYCCSWHPPLMAPMLHCLHTISKGLCFLLATSNTNIFCKPITRLLTIVLFKKVFAPVKKIWWSANIWSHRNNALGPGLTSHATSWRSRNGNAAVTLVFIWLMVEYPEDVDKVTIKMASLSGPPAHG